MGHDNPDVGDVVESKNPQEMDNSDVNQLMIYRRLNRLADALDNLVGRLEQDKASKRYNSSRKQSRLYESDEFESLTPLGKDIKDKTLEKGTIDKHDVHAVLRLYGYSRTDVTALNMMQKLAENDEDVEYNGKSSKTGMGGQMATLQDADIDNSTQGGD